MTNDTRFIVAETKNGRAFPHWARVYRPGQYAEAVRAGALQRGADVVIQTDDEAAKYESERLAVRVAVITRDDADEWYDPDYADAPVMREMRALGWVVEVENMELDEVRYELVDREVE
jgi:hypothetical protein